MANQFKYTADLVAKVASDVNLQQQIKGDPVGTLTSMSATPLQTDAWIYRILVTFLGITVITVVIASANLVGAGKTTPEGIVAINWSISSLAGLIVQPSAKN